MKTIRFFACLFITLVFVSCKQNSDNTSPEKREIKVRTAVDTVGFAQYAYQMDSIISRINDSDKVQTEDTYKVAICPHDDYSYVGGLYSKTLAGIKAHTIVLVGVAHKARNYELQDKIVFGSFDQWKSVYGNVNVSHLRDDLINALPDDLYIVHDSMMIVEHSLEALVPFLQSKNRDVQIVPVLIPYMKYEDMIKISGSLSETLYKLMLKEKLIFGKDLAIIISNDAVHYGDEDWGRDDMAPFGTDSIGNEKARQKDLEIIENCLKGELSDEKIKLFTEYTVQKSDYKEYKWVWCGRYAVPFGLMLADRLNRKFGQSKLKGTFIDYRTSYLNEHIEVKDIGMGATAPANQHHWVAYAGVVYE